MTSQKSDLYEFNGFLLNCAERTLMRGDRPVAIAPKAMETLCLLVENRGRLMTKNELMDELWADTFVEERNLAQNIFTLRKILGEGGDGKKIIETVPKRGYRFIADVRIVECEEELIEVSLARQTTITAESEGDVSSEELAEAVKETARSLALEKEIEEPYAARSGTAGKPLRAFLTAPVLALCAFSIAAAGIWYWRAGGENQKTVIVPDAGSSKIELVRLTDSGKAWNPAISPDGQQIAYVFHDRLHDSIRLQNLATKSIVEVVPPDEKADYGRLLFSKDGNFLYFHTRDGGKEGVIYQTPIYGGFIREIVRNVRSDYSLSPDGGLLAFFRYDGPSDETRLIVCRSDGSEERIVTARKGKNMFRVWEVFPDWSPDGTKIVASAITQYTDDDGEKNREHLVEIDVAAGSERKLEMPEFFKIGQALWMQDGKSLIVLAQEKAESPFQIWQISYPDGRAKRFTNDLTDYFRLSLSPQGDFLLTNERRAFYNIWTIDVGDATRTKQLTSNTNLKNGYYGLTWTPDGREIIYVQSDGAGTGNVRAVDAETGKTRPITHDEGEIVWFPTVTPDGNSVIFASPRTGNWHLWQVNVDGSGLRQITDGIGENFPLVSPDGEWLVYATSCYFPQNLWKKPLKGDGEAVKLFDNAGGPAHISADSRHIAIHNFEKGADGINLWRYVIMPLQEGAAEAKIIDLDPENAIVRWKPDGSGFYFMNRNRDFNNIWFYSLAGGEMKQITNYDQMKIVNLSVSPDGKKFAVARGEAVSDIIKISGF